MNRASKILISISYFGLFLAYTSANRSPATGYELSIYQSTPLVFWLGVGVTALTSIYLVQTYRGGVQVSGMVTGLLAIISVVSIPYLRGYFYYGRFDALNHLGTVIDMLSGTIEVNEIMYPGLHMFTVGFSLLTGLEPRQALLMTVTVFVGLFLVTAPLATYYVTNNLEIRSTAWLVGPLLLPVLAVRIPRFEPTPTLVALLFLPTCIIVTLNHLEYNNQSVRVVSILVLSGLTLYHPQQTVVYIGSLIVFVTGCLLLQQIGRPIDGYHRLATLTMLGVVIVAVWLSSQPGFTGAVAEVIIGLQSNPTGSGATPQGESVEAVGLTLFEIFMRTFLVEAIAASIVAVTVFGYLLPKTRSTIPVRDRPFTLLSVIIGPASVFLLVFFAIGEQSQFLRYVSYMLVIGTLIVPIGLHWIINENVIGRHSTTIVGLILVVLLLATIPSFHASPYLFQSNQQVTEGQMNGYKKTFDHQEPDTSVTGVTTSVYRHRNALYGKTASEQGRLGLQSVTRAIQPPNNLRSYWRHSYIHYSFNDQNLPNAVERNTYVIVTDRDYADRIELYGGLAYTKTDFEYLDRDPLINKPISNGDAEIYYIRPTTDTGE
ncbi:hypothetical protein [Natronoglomus mannanivorans]|uniref:Uncharacterized protein n=1 Tax=Natronoglomus mannanivorans TaxID=2979990 RepID=A0AAP3E3M6_9EURY|nr:hypothetical protein [Halobacteria archaeon AArc-xg1-1]